MHVGDKILSKRKPSTPHFPSAASLQTIKPHLFIFMYLDTQFLHCPLCGRVSLNIVEKSVVTEMLTELAALELKATTKLAQRGKLNSFDFQHAGKY